MSLPGVGYDDLDVDAQREQRAAWDVAIGERLTVLDLVGEFEAEGMTYAELDEDGAVVVRRARGA